MQDRAASDSMEPTLQVMKVNRLIRSAVGLVKGTQLRQSEDSFEIVVLSGILWFKVSLQLFPYNRCTSQALLPMHQMMSLVCWLKLATFFSSLCSFVPVLPL